MTKEDIDHLTIEHRGPRKYWNITMFVVPKKGPSRAPHYGELVALAEETLRVAKGLGEEWFPSNAEVMAWSSREDRGILTPDRYRITLDMITEDMEDDPGEEME